MNAREIHNLAQRALDKLQQTAHSFPHAQRLRNMINFTRGVHQNSKVNVTMEDWLAIASALDEE